MISAIDYVVRKAIEYNRPTSINISFGNNYGDHAGSILLETYIDSISRLYKTVISIGVGNEGVTGRHVGGRLNGRTGSAGNTVDGTEIEFAVSQYEKSINLQIWKNLADVFDVYLISPSNRTVGPINNTILEGRFAVDGTYIDALYGVPSPYNSRQEIYISFIPQGDYIASGLWKIRLVPKTIVNGEYNIWLPVAGATNTDTFFLQSTADLTLISMMQRN